MYQGDMWECVAHDAIREAAGRSDEELLEIADELFWRIQHVGSVPPGFDTRRAYAELAAALKKAADDLGLQPIERAPHDEESFLVDGTDDEACDLPPIEFEYRNWRGEVRVRRARPVRMIYGSNEWHPQEQWMMEAVDAETLEMRTFALSGILRYLPDPESLAAGDGR